ncbi:hypothetical protein B0H13DRAFT_1859558 [Mycena leptocephala]|nr:hypothetical protein B0H13DRAFT_1859558 [Mycena leptocephala]
MRVGSRGAQHIHGTVTVQPPSYSKSNFDYPGAYAFPTGDTWTGQHAWDVREVVQAMHVPLPRRARGIRGTRHAHAASSTSRGHGLWYDGKRGVTHLEQECGACEANTPAPKSGASAKKKGKEKGLGTWCRSTHAHRRKVENCTNAFARP